MNKATVQIESPFFQDDYHMGKSRPTKVPIMKGPLYIADGELLDPPVEVMNGTQVVQGYFQKMALIVEPNFPEQLTVPGWGRALSRLMEVKGNGLHQAAYYAYLWAEGRGFGVDKITGNETLNNHVYSALEKLVNGSNDHSLFFIYLSLYGTKYGSGGVMCLNPALSKHEPLKSPAVILPGTVREILDTSPGAKIIFIDTSHATYCFKEQLPDNSVVIYSSTEDELAVNTFMTERFNDYVFAKGLRQFAINYGTIDFTLEGLFGGRKDLSKIPLTWAHRRRLKYAPKNPGVSDPSQKVQTLNAKSNANIILF